MQLSLLVEVSCKVRVFMLNCILLGKLSEVFMYNREDERDFAGCGVSEYMYNQIYYHRAFHTICFFDHKAFPAFCFCDEFPTIERERLR